MSDRILTTHAGSLPRPDELADMIWARLDGQEVDETALQEQIEAGVTDVVAKQRAAGIDVISDGELSKTGFSTYVNERFSGFDGRSEFQADDVADFPNLAMRLFNTPSMAHIVFSNCVGPVELSDKQAVHQDVDRLKRALGDADPRNRVHGRDQPRPDRVQLPRPALRIPRDVPWRACRRAVLRVPGDCRRGLEPADRLARTWRWPPTAGRSAAASATGTTTCRSPSTRSTRRSRGSRRSRFACMCAGAITPARTTRTSPLDEIVGEALRVNAGTIYVEGANPRHAHEWRVFEHVDLPDDKSVILGVIDVKANCVEHPRLVADRLVALGRIVGKERVIGGTDCGFDTFIRFSQVDPDVAWLKLRSLTEGAEIASGEL